MKLADIRRRLVIQEVSNKNKQNKYPSFEEIKKSVEYQLEALSDYKGEELEYPKSTFDKDKKYIRAVLKCNLVYKKREGGYLIEFEEDSFFKNDMFDSFMFLYGLNAKVEMLDYIIPDNRKNTGLNHFAKIGLSIKEKKKLEIDYFKYDTQSEEHKVIYPYKLKQKDFRWYVLAKEEGDNVNPFKSFALERIKSLEVLDEKFVEEEIDFDTPFENAFGMFTDGEVETIVFEVDKRDGNYLMSNPIHSSQKVKENEHSMEFTLQVKPTLDLIMELMRRTWSIEIKQPKSLREKFYNYYKDALERNK